MESISGSYADDALFVNGIPASISPQDWRRFHLQSFPAFADEEDAEIVDQILEEAIEVIYSMWTGVSYLWADHNKQVYYEKTRLCYRFLICWYIADIYPNYSPGIVSTAGLPIVRKKLGPVDISYSKESATPDSIDLMKPLLSNAFGAKAHFMIKTCYRRMRITNGRADTALGSGRRII